MQIDHIGYAVKKIDRAMHSFELLGYQFGNIIDDTDRNIKLSFGEKDGYRIELVQPLDRNQPSPVDTYLNSIGSSPYHICYMSNSFEEDVSNLLDKGFRIVVEPQKAVAFGGKKVVFIMNLGIGLMEIVEA